MGLEDLYLKIICGFLCFFTNWHIFLNFLKVLLDFSLILRYYLLVSNTMTEL